jgi:hypothetical protein
MVSAIRRASAAVTVGNNRPPQLQLGQVEVRQRIFVVQLSRPLEVSASCRKFAQENFCCSEIVQRQRLCVTRVGPGTEPCEMLDPWAPTDILQKLLRVACRLRKLPFLQH